jgi:hypothetical protein
LTTQSSGIDGARQAAADLAVLWFVEKHANNEATQVGFRQSAAI